MCLINSPSTWSAWSQTYDGQFARDLVRELERTIDHATEADRVRMIMLGYNDVQIRCELAAEARRRWEVFHAGMARLEVQLSPPLELSQC